MRAMITIHNPTGKQVLRVLGVLGVLRVLIWDSVTWTPLTDAQKTFVQAIKSSASTDIAAKEAIAALGLKLPLPPPSPIKLRQRGRKMAIPATVIDLAAMSRQPTRFIYAVNQDKTKYNGGVSKESSPLCVLAGFGYQPLQHEAIAQMKVVIEAGFDVNAKEFAQNKAMAAKVTK